MFNIISNYQYLLVPICLIMVMFTYLNIAKYYNIIDKPNERSAHSEVTIRGGGVIFPLAILLSIILNGQGYIYFNIGLLLISIVSFIDDVITLPNFYRLITQSIAAMFLFIELANGDIFLFFFGYVVIYLVFTVGIINAYNFMDGINGITGMYSLITLLTLSFVNTKIDFINSEILYYEIFAVLIFLYFNFREKAKCFAGDVGSVSIGYIIIFTLTLLMWRTNNIKYIFYLACYGIDTIYTLIYRLFKRENIFVAHKAHFFQILVHDFKLSHLQVSLLFATVQLLLNFWINLFEIDIIFFIPVVLIVILVHFFRTKKNKGISLVHCKNT